MYTAAPSNQYVRYKLIQIPPSRRVCTIIRTADESDNVESEIGGHSGGTVALGRQLVLYLQRFELNLEMMLKVKMNSELRFPLALNMKRFKKSRRGRRQGAAATHQGAPGPT